MPAVPDQALPGAVRPSGGSGGIRRQPAPGGAVHRGQERRPAAATARAHARARRRAGVRAGGQAAGPRPRGGEDPGEAAHGVPLGRRPGHLRAVPGRGLHRGPGHLRAPGQAHRQPGLFPGRPSLRRRSDRRRPVDPVLSGQPVRSRGGPGAGGAGRPRRPRGVPGRAQGPSGHRAPAAAGREAQAPGDGHEQRPPGFQRAPRPGAGAGEDAAGAAAEAASAALSPAHRVLRHLHDPGNERRGLAGVVLRRRARQAELPALPRSHRQPRDPWRRLRHDVRGHQAALPARSPGDRPAGSHGGGRRQGAVAGGAHGAGGPAGHRRGRGGHGQDARHRVAAPGRDRALRGTPVPALPQQPRGAAAQLQRPVPAPAPP